MAFGGKKKEDIHTRLMKNYKSVPTWWFLIILVANIGLIILACEYYNESLQLPWWGVLLACALAIGFTLPIGVINATTNQVMIVSNCTSKLRFKTICQNQSYMLVSNSLINGFCMFSGLTATGFEHHHRICYWVPVSRTPCCQYVLQSIWLHQHDSSSIFPARF